MSANTQKKLAQMLLANKNNDSNQINNLAERIDETERKNLIFLLGPKDMSKDLPGGKYHDVSSWTTMENTLQCKGMTVKAVSIQRKLDKSVIF